MSQNDMKNKTPDKLVSVSLQGGELLSKSVTSDAHIKNPELMAKPSSSPRVLIFSQRNIFRKTLFRCPHYEFEDIICDIDSAEIMAPETELFSLRHNIANRVAYHAPIALNPGIPKIRIKTEYELFLAVCGVPRDLLMVNAVSNWKDFCKTSVCLIDECWLTQMHDLRYFLRILARFDVVLLYYSQSVKAFSERIARKCMYLPPGIDAITFCPYPKPPQRVIDVCSIGRRSEVTHQRLLSMAADNGLFYLYDTIAGDQAINSKQHRALLANVAKRSRYFIVNPGLIDRPDIRGNQVEIGNRYFEGAASGSIMIGERPDNDEFESLFGWPDALIHLPYGSGDIDAIIQDLDKLPERQDKVRRTNTVESLRRHDWVYRWETVLKIAGLKPTPGLLQRKERLENLAKAIENETPISMWK
jgi:hypothetical protein